MKKKILVVSLAVNIIAGAFVFYSFTSKMKNVNDGGGYIIMSAVRGSGISITDGISTLESEKIELALSRQNLLEFQQKVAQKLNELKSKGYELISSNGGDQNTVYVFVKK